VPFAFVLKKVATVTPPPGGPSRSETFNLKSTMDGQRFIFRFSWNGYKQFYAVTISRESGENLKRWYPIANDEIFIRNWNPDSFDRSDAMLVMLDSSGMERPITPSSFGSTHSLVVYLGRIKEL